LAKDRKDTGAVFGTGIGRKRPKPGRGAVVGSVVFHGALLGALYAGGLHRATLPDFEIYRVQLRSPPPQQQAQVPEVAPVAPQPIEAPPRTVEPQREVAQPKPEPPKPEPPKPEPAKQPPPTEAPKPAVTTAPKTEEKPKEPEPTKGPEAQADSRGGENLDVNMEGREFPYPAYLENIITQLYRHFRWSGNPKLQAEVAFYISRDGTVGGITVSRKSGDFNFDMEAMAAVEQVGRRGLFGPLPEGWVDDRLWVRFRFLPPGT
jgi:outer membrane biosynthesis protein TonB